MQTVNLEGYPLSPQQRRAHLLLQAGGALGALVHVTLTGPLRPDALAAALQTAVDRHEILRTRFQTVAGLLHPLQVIDETGKIALTVHDLSGRSAEQSAAELERLGRELPPQQTAVLARLATDRHVLLLSLPALCADSRSLDLLVSEIALAYAGELDTEADDELLQYTQYSDWVLELPESEDGEAGLAHWQQIDLSGLASMRLPYEKGDASAAFAPQTVALQLSASDAAGLRTAAAARQADLSDLLLTAWTVFFHRLLGTPETVIGKVVDGRKFEELETAVGLFAHSAPFLVELTDDTSFAAALALVTEQAALAEEHSELRCTEDAPLVPFQFESGERFAARADRVAFEVSAKQAVAERFHLKLVSWIGDEDITLQLQYDPQRLRAEDTEMLAGYFTTLLAAVAAAPEAAVGSYPLLQASDIERLVLDFNRTEATFPADLCVHQLFEAQVAKRPDEIAVSCGDERLTFAELNAAANRLARHLQGLGIGPDGLVGLCTERSVELAVGILGVLKAGGAYVPFDPSYPQDRIDYMLTDSAVSVLLTQERLADRFAAYSGRLLRLDADSAEFAGYEAGDLPCAVTPDNLCYVIYTSGSTGRPKGTLIHHRGAVNYVDHCAKTYPMAEGAGAPVHSSVAFDLTVTSMLAPLTAGKKVVLLPESSDIEALGDLLRSHGAFSLVKITPAHLNLLNHQLSPTEAAASTRSLVIGGENLIAESIAFWREHAPGTRLINEYGPTEATVGCVVYDVPADAVLTGSVPIGRPIQNVQIYLLDSRMQPVPIGVAGEMYIGGVGVARGYLNRPDLTAERFLADPFRDDENARLYKTGDLARYLPDGTIEYLGRLDEQVKIRGYRIELGEIETVLDAHPAVKEAVVIAREDEQGDKQLVGYLVTEGGSADLQSELRQHLLTTLPDYMVPAFLVEMDALPLTANGKVDRKKLPAPGDSDFHRGSQYLAPRNQVEYRLTKLWEELLGLSQIGIRDDFMKIGGHSLLAVKLVARIQNEFGYDLPLSALFQNGTIERIAEAVAGAEAGQPSTPLVPMQPNGTKAPFFCVHAGTGNALAYLELSRALPADRPFYGLQAQGIEDEQTPLSTIETMAVRYLEEVRGVQPQGPYYLGGWCFGGLVAFEMARLLQEQGEEIALLTLIDTVLPQNTVEPEPLDDLSYELWWVRTNAAQFGIDPSVIAGLDEQSVEAMLTVMLEEAKKNGVMPLGIDLVRFRRLLKVFGGIKLAFESYRPGAAPLAVQLLRAAEQPPELAANLHMGWTDIAQGGIVVTEVPGNHDTMVEPPHVATLAARLTEMLDAADGKQQTGAVN